MLIALTPAIVAADSGGVLPWTQWAMSITAAVALLLTIPTCASTDRVTTIFGAAVPLTLLLVALYGYIQSVPSSLAASVAPASSTIYLDMADTVRATDPDAVAQSVFPITVSRWLTMQSIAALVVVAVFGFAASQVFVTRKRITLLLVVFAITGAVQAGFGVYQILSDPTATVWGIHSLYGGAPFGSFINRSNAAVMLNIGLACGLGLIAWRLAATTGTALNNDHFPFRELLDVVFDPVAVLGVVTSLLATAGLLMSGSRGGLVGTVAGLLTGFGLVQSLHRGRGLLISLLGVALIAAILLVQLELPARTIDRFKETPETVAETGFYDGRLEHWQDGWRTGLAQPIVGWGLGTYRFAYLPFQLTSPAAWCVNADNLWLEWFVETGVVGTLIMAILVVVICRALTELNLSADPIDHGLATAGWFALGALAVSQFFDFGLRIPANSVAASVLFAAAIARRSLIGNLTTHSENKKSLFRFFRNPLSRIAVANRGPALNLILFIVFAVVLYPAVGFLNSWARGDHASRVAKVLPRGSQFDPDLASQLAQSLSQHTEGNPDDWQSLLQLSRLRVDIARFNAATTVAEVSAAPAAWIANYRALSPKLLRETWYEGVRPTNSSIKPPAPLFPFAASSSASDDSEALFESEAAFTPIVHQQRQEFGAALHAARRTAIEAAVVCPLSDEAIAAVTSLDFAGGSVPQSLQLIERLAILRIRNGDSQLFAGKLAMQAGLWDLASETLYRAMSLSPYLTGEALLAIPNDSPLSIVELIPNIPDVVAAAAWQELTKAKPNRALLTRATETLERALPSERRKRVERLQLIARIYNKREQPQPASENLAKAMSLVPNDINIRYQYALALRAAGNVNEARQQARAGRQIAPDDPRFEQLITAMSQGPLE